MYLRKKILIKNVFFTSISRAKKKDEFLCYKMYSRKTIDKNFNKYNYILKYYITKKPLKLNYTSK